MAPTAIPKQYGKIVKKIKIFTLLLFLVFAAWNAKSQQNNHHGVQDPILKGDITTAAYAISEIDVAGNLNGDITFISSFTCEDVPNNETRLHFRRTKICFDDHFNYYDAAIIPYVSSPGGYQPFAVNDLIEVKGTGRYEVVICGTLMGKEGYVAMFDRMFNPITDLNLYFPPVHIFHSIVEVPGFGFLACGEGYGSDFGVVVALDYNLNLISTYSSPDYKFTDIVYNAADYYAYMAGYSNNNELCAYGLVVRDMYTSQPNPILAGFTYYNPSQIIDWNASGKDDVKIINTYDKYVAIAASGKDIRTGMNIGILHENLIDGSQPGANIMLRPITNRTNNIYLKGLVQIQNKTYNLLLLEESAGLFYPRILDVVPNSNTMDVIYINNPVETTAKMLKRSSCKMLDILSFNNSNMLFYSSCHASNFQGLLYHPIESYLNFPISLLNPIINKAPALYEVACIHNPHFLQGNTPIGSWVGASVSYWGDCFPSCVRNAYIEDEALGHLGILALHRGIVLDEVMVEIQVEKHALHVAA